MSNMISFTTKLIVAHLTPYESLLLSRLVHYNTSSVDYSKRCDEMDHIVFATLDELPGMREKSSITVDHVDGDTQFVTVVMSNVVIIPMIVMRTLSEVEASISSTMVIHYGFFTAAKIGKQASYKMINDEVNKKRSELNRELTTSEIARVSGNLTNEMITDNIRRMNIVSEA